MTTKVRLITNSEYKILFVNLKQIIKETIIKRSGPIGFDEFMDIALYFPGLGYYSSGVTKFGEQGDFITAPEISDLFGYTLARQCDEVINGKNDILEFGAGTGILATQILFELGRMGNLPNKYYILELSAELRHRQKQTISKVLPEIVDKVVWLESLPSNFSGVVIANEVLDAMPAKRLICKDESFYELGVNIENGDLAWDVIESLFIKNNVLLPNNVVNDYKTEVNYRSMAWINSLYSSMDECLVLIIDYGMDRAEFFHPQRGEGTLRCYYKHKASDNPFTNLGKQDITTSVNFSDIADQAKESGFNVAGYATQAMFLISLGIDNYLSKEDNEKQRIKLSQQIKQLVLPNAMGESFKVLALTKNLKLNLKGFNEQDLRHKL